MDETVLAKNVLTEDIMVEDIEDRTVMANNKMDKDRGIRLWGVRMLWIKIWGIVILRRESQTEARKRIYPVRGAYQPPQSPQPLS